MKKTVGVVTILLVLAWAGCKREGKNLSDYVLCSGGCEPVYGQTTTHVLPYREKPFKCEGNKGCTDSKEGPCSCELFSQDVSDPDHPGAWLFVAEEGTEVKPNHIRFRYECFCVKSEN